MIVLYRKPGLSDRLCTETLDDPIAVPNPTLVFRSEDYESRWTAIQRRSISELFEKLDVKIIFDETHEMSDDDLADALGRKRDAPWGFAVGDRVRMTKLGYSGKVTASEECPFGNMAPDGPFFQHCNRICPNVTFYATHRTNTNGTIETVTEGSISCPPADLEHCD